MKLTKKLIVAALAVVMAVSFGILTGCGAKPDPVGTVTKVEITNPQSVAFVGDEFALRAVVTVEGGKADQTVTWKSSDDTVATVGMTGKLTAKKTGTVTVTATSVANSAVTAETRVEVLENSLPINGSFDRAELGWGIYPEKVTYELAQNVAHDGVNSLKVTTEEAYTVLFYPMSIGESEFALKKGGFYVIEAYVYSEVASPTAKPRVHFQNVKSASDKEDLGTVPATLIAEANTWTRISSATVRIPDTATSFNAMLEVHGAGEIYFDSVKVIEVASNDTRLATLTADGTSVDKFSNDVDTFTVETDAGLPVEIAATAIDSNTDVAVTQGTLETPTATVLITAKDGTTRTVTVNFVRSEPVNLKEIKIGGKAFAEFTPTRTEYYIQLPKGTTAVPAVTYVKNDAGAEVAESMPETLPGTITLTVTKDSDVKVYSVYCAVTPDNQYSMQYSNTSFESDLTGWGTDEGVTVDALTSHSGLKSMKAGANKAGWMGFELGTNLVTPAKGDAVIGGAWVFIPTTAAITGTVNVEVFEKANGPHSQMIASVYQAVVPSDTGKWMFVKTSASTEVSDATGYLQIVVRNATDATVYFDDIRMFQTSAVPAPTETIIDIPAFDFGFESDSAKYSDSWGPGDPLPVFEMNTDKFHAGAGSLKVTAAQNSGFKYVLDINDSSVLKVGDRFKFGAWIYVDEASDADTTLVKVEKQDGYIFHKESDGTKGAWLFVETDVLTVADGTTTLVLIIANEKPGTAVYYVDDVTLIKITQS